MISGSGQVDLGVPQPTLGNPTPSNSWTDSLTITGGVVSISNANAVSYPSGRGRAGLPIKFANGGSGVTGLRISSSLALPNNLVFADHGGRIDVVDGATATLSGSYSSFGVMRKIGGGTLVLSGDGSSFQGQAVVDAGVLRVTNNFANQNAELIVNGGGAFESASNTAMVIRSLNGAGDVRLGDNA